MSNEITFERLAAVLESTWNTAVTPPDHNVEITGTLDPQQEYATVNQNYGLSTESTDEDQLVRQTAAWGGDTKEGGANTELLPWWMNLAVQGGVTAPLTNDKVVASVGSITGGSGYTGPFTVTFTGGSPKVPAKGTATVAAGAVTAVTITNPGIGYATAPTPVFTAGGGTGATGTATLATPSTAKLWEFIRNLSADDRASATAYWGDPNGQIFQGAGARLESFELDGDASGTKLVAVKAKGFSQFPTKVAAPAFPSGGAGYYLIPKTLRLWIDPGTNNFGDTEITGRVVSANLIIPTGATPKYLAESVGGTLGISRVGVKPMRPTLKIVFEFLDTTQYDLAMVNGSTPGGVRQKVRVRWNGPKIETTGGYDFYHYCEAEIYGGLRAAKWGANASTNRTLELTVQGSYLSSAATDLTVRVRNIRATL